MKSHIRTGVFLLLLVRLACPGSALAAVSSSPRPLALIVGVGDGLSASIARRFHQEGYTLVLSSRNTDKIQNLATEVQATTISCDASQMDDVENLFGSIKKEHPTQQLQVVVYNPSRIARGPIDQVDPRQVRRSIEVTAFGSFLVAQQAAKLMLSTSTPPSSSNIEQQQQKQQPRGTILFTGASAGVKGFARSAAFAMGKHAQRGLAESMARELHPQNIHVCWINIDGAICNPARRASTKNNNDDSMLDPNAIAETYLQLVKQDRSAWSSEMTLRPWTERW